jgi:6-phosphofructokinase 2
VSRILTLTLNPAVDVATTVERLIDSSKLRCTPARRDPGGGGINVARVIHRLGGDCVALYLAGGATGRMLDEMIDAEGVRSISLRIRGETRENFSVRETSTGREYRFVLPGPAVSDHEWQSCLSHIAGMETVPRYLVLSGSVPPGVPDDIYARIARRARETGARVVLDTSGPALAAALDVGVFMVKPSLSELRKLTGAPLVEESQWLDAARTIVAQGKAEVVALSLGELGALVVTATRTLRAPALAVPVSSSIGAGDSFVAAMVWALDRGDELEEAVRYAVAAASATLLAEGTGLCEPGAVDQMLQEYARAHQAEVL